MVGDGRSYLSSLKKKYANRLWKTRSKISVRTELALPLCLMPARRPNKKGNASGKSTVGEAFLKFSTMRTSRRRYSYSLDFATVSEIPCVTWLCPLCHDDRQATKALHREEGRRVARKTGSRSRSAKVSLRVPSNPIHEHCASYSSDNGSSPDPCHRRH
jgi:hypothetical protein